MENELKDYIKKIIIYIGLFILTLFIIYGYIILGNKISALKYNVHEKEQELIKKDLEIKLLKIEKENFEKYYNEFKENQARDSIYYSIIKTYEKH